MGEEGMSNSMDKASRAQSRDPEEFWPVEVSSQRGGGAYFKIHTHLFNAAQATVHEEGKPRNLRIIWKPTCW